jgi:hypothetical protein
MNLEKFTETALAVFLVLMMIFSTVLVIALIVLIVVALSGGLPS